MRRRASKGGIVANPTVDELVLAFTRIRDARAELKRTYEENDKKLSEGMTTIENELLRRADEQGVDGFKTASGTTYTSETQHISIKDDDSWVGFLKEENDPSYLERRPSLRRVKEYMEANGGKLPPGLTMFREKHMRVRAKGE